MGFIDDHRVVAGSVQVLQNPLLLEEINGHEAQGNVIEGIGTQLRAPPNLVELGTVDHLQPQAKPLRHFCLPLLQQRPSRGDHENAVGQTPSDQLGKHQAGLNGLAQAHAIAKEQPHAAHADRPKYRHELVRLDPQAAGLDRQQGVRPQGLFQEKCLVVDEPVGQRRRAVRTKVMDDWLDRLEGVEDIEFLSQHRVFQAAEPEQRLRPEAFAGNNFPAKPSRMHLSPRQQLLCADHHCSHFDSDNASNPHQTPLKAGGLPVSTARGK